MNTLKIKTATGKSVEVEPAEIIDAAVGIFANTFAENHSVIVWWAKETGRFAIVPYNSKLHSDEN